MFNDNLVRNGLVALALFRTNTGGLTFTAVSTTLLIVPYVLLSATAGQVADKFPKHRVIVITKAAEVVLMTAAAIGFVTGSEGFLLFLLLGFGSKAALIDPARYGIIPEHLTPTELVPANAAIEAANFLAILFGTIVGGAVILLDAGPYMLAGVGLLIAIIGLIAAIRIPSSTGADPSLRIRANIGFETGKLIRQAMVIRAVWFAILGLSWFWAAGALMLTEFPTITRDVLGADGQVATLLLTAFAVGIGIGSVLCARLLKGEISSKYVPVAAFGISVFCWDFARSVTGADGLTSVAYVLSSTAGWRILADLLMVSVCGGAFSVPLYALLQYHSPPDVRGRLVAANSILNAGFMITASGVATLLHGAGFLPQQVIQLFAAANLFVGLGTLRLLANKHSAH